MLDRLPLKRVYVDENVAKKLIPKGCYCYDSNGICPFWDKFENFDNQESGYCHYLEAGDFMSREKGGTFLLWDQCKECGINDDDDSLYLTDLIE